jgi:tetratricopeptide (TPR) repeat protein
VKPGPLAAAAVLAAAVLVSHLPLLSAGYVQDDHVAVEGSSIVAEGAASAIVGSSYWEGARGGDRTLYRPVTVASYAMERAAAGGPRAGLSHAINLLLHAVVSWLVFALAARAGVDPRAAILGALLFALSPSKSEAVANVVGRAEILAAAFTLAAVRLAFEPGRRIAAWTAAACVLLACCSKETGVVALPLVLIAALAVPGRRALDVAGTLASCGLAFVIFVVLRTQALEAFFPPQIVPAIDNPLVGEHGVRYLATALGLIPRYARIALFPFGLANDYSCASIPIESSLVAVRPIAGIALLAAGAVIATRSRAAALFAAIALLPYLLVSNLLLPVGAIFAERFLYLPMAGGCLLAALAIEKMRKPARIASLAAAAIFGVAMFARASDWKDDATVFAATARNNPRSPRAFLWTGKPAQAITCCPEFAAAWHDQGVALAKAGDLPGAERALREAIRLEPQRTAPHLNLGIVLHRRGELAAAEREVHKAALLDPDNARAFAELGHLRYEQRRFKDAADAYRRAIALGRTDLLPRLGALE